eukprot:SAG11_NODE_6978_length_1215_cov_1.761649_1_plen_41_part_00
MLQADKVAQKYEKDPEALKKAAEDLIKAGQDAVGGKAKAP